MKDMVSMGLRHERGKLFVLDQQKLPHQELWLECKSPQEMVDLIHRLAVRGAPLIGVAAALELARYYERGATKAAVREAAGMLRVARPTAVNLMAAVDRMLAALAADELVKMAETIFDEDVALCEDMACHGELLIKDGDRILTHCNTGGLATVGIGTALGVIRRAFENGKRIHVYVDETRPLLQGARLTAWELTKLGIPFTLISDNMAGMLMAQKKIDIAFVGSDRIAANGDAANKIGTYSVAVLAHYHHVPFYVVAPYTTVDKSCATGADIPIEERNSDEIRGEAAPRGCAVYNPAFDVTPRKLITALVLNTGLA